MHPEGRPHVFISSPRLTLAKLHESFMEPPPQPLHSPLSSWVVRRAMSIVALSYLQRCWTTSAVNSVPGSLRRDRGIPNVNSNSTNFLATFSASCWVVDRRTGICWLSSPTTRRCLFPASNLAPMSWMSISRISQGWRKRVGSMVTRWLVDLLSVRHPQEGTWFRMSPLSDVQWYFRCVRSVVRATPGWS